jgi:uncharacterized protein (DUF4415 family)
MADEWDDNPEWTAEDFARAVPTRQLLGDAVADALLRKPGRPKLPENAAKQAISLRVAPDILAAMRATGRGWQTRAEAILRREFLRG